MIAALKRFEGELGGRDALVETLSHAPLSKDQQYIVGLLADPAYADASLADLCRRGNIKLPELWGLLRSAALAKASVKATLVVGQHLPAVVSDVMRRAQVHEEPCAYCEGTGTIVDEPTAEDPNPEPYRCPKCEGKGRFRHLPELDRQVVALKLGGLLKDGAGLTINNLNQAFANPDAVGSYDQLLTAADQALEGEVVRPDEAIDPDDIGEGPDADQ